MKIWIPGGNGLVGKALQKLCKNQHLAFIATGHADVDISSLSAIKDFFNSHPDITHIINCAAYTRVDDAESQEEEAYKANTLGPENLGKLARQKNLKLVHLSTDYVFDSDKTHLLKEQDLCAPASIYAKTKHEGELKLLEEFPHACIVRTSWVFGEGGKNFISSLWDKLHREKKITVVHDQVNRLTSASDLAEVLLSLLCHEGIYHFANQGIVSRYEIAQEMQKLLQGKGQALLCEEIAPVPASNFPAIAPRPRFSALDTQKIETVVGITPRPWQLALKDYIDEKLA